jgi:hypothetical protein
MARVAGYAGAAVLAAVAAAAVGVASIGGLTTTAQGSGRTPAGSARVLADPGLSLAPAGAAPTTAATPASTHHAESGATVPATAKTPAAKGYVVVGAVNGGQVLGSSTGSSSSRGSSGSSNSSASSGTGGGTGSPGTKVLGGRTLNLNGIAVLEGSAGLAQTYLPNPAQFSMQTSAAAVTIGWSDGANSPDYRESAFTVYKRSNAGAWEPVHTVTARHDIDGDNYTWVDTAKDVSGQCYTIASIGDGNSGWSTEECTVRPDPSAFPQTAPAATVQWYGLSRVNDGTAPLYDAKTDQNLAYQDRTFGVSLGWQQAGTDNIKLQRQGNNDEPLMTGEAVALRAWGGGWLSYGQQTFGIDLHLSLSDAPAYQWYVVGDGAPGHALDNGEFALWNRANGDYLVEGDQTWSINLNWYQKTISQQSNPTTTTTHGLSRLTIFNCTVEERPLEVWAWDVTAGSGWVDKGQLNPEYSDGGCPGSSSGYTFTPVSGHSYVVETVDYTAPDCSNDPGVGCERSTTTFTGDSGGYPSSITVS